MPAAKQTPLPTFDAEYLAGDLEVKTATETDFPYILDRSKLWSNQQGFIPAEGMRKLVEEGRGLICRVNGERAGYLLTSGGIRRPLVVRHNTVEESLWSCGVGCQLMRAVLEWSLWSRRHFVLVRTRADLARQTAINVKLRGLILGQDETIGKREQPVNIWSVPTVPTLFRSEPIPDEIHEPLS